MKLSNRAFPHDYWNEDVDVLPSGKGKVRLKRGLKRELSKARRQDSKKYINVEVRAEGLTL